MKFNKLTVLETVKHNGRNMYRTLCDCGRVDIKRIDWVQSGRATSCKNCASKETAVHFPPPVTYKGYGELSGTHYNTIKFGAEKRNIPFEVTPEYLWNLYLKQNGKCALSGVDITLNRSLKDNNVNWDVINASVDRIDNSIGYVEGNVWWTHKEVNRLKNNYSLEELVKWCKLIVEKHGNPDPSLSGDTLEGATTRDRVSRDSNIPTSAQHPGTLDETLAYIKSMVRDRKSVMDDDIV